MLYIELDKSLKRTYTNQIYQQFREKILCGELKYGEPFPSTREVAKELNVSRNTVIAAFDVLISEGLAYSIKGSGIFVNKSITILPQPQKVKSDFSASSLPVNYQTQDYINFDSGIPALDLFPRSRWNRYISNAFAEAPDSALGYDEPQGRPELREVLSSYLKKTRGISCSPDQIIITSGAKQGLTLIAKCLLKLNSGVLIEDPSNKNVRQIFSYHTSNITPIPVDSEGIQTNLLPTTGNPELLFVTPSHQFPMGGVLPIQRRLDLINFARENDCYIVEDDYDSEFRYDGVPVHSLFELDNEHVIYVGTFSKIMFPSIRLGYLVLPYPLIEQCCELKRLADHHSNSINQIALSHFIESGDLERHIKRMKKNYLIRQRLLISLLEQKFSKSVRLSGTSSGMHVVASFNNIEFSDELICRIRKNGLYLVPIESHAIVKGAHLNEVILGYAHLDQEKMARGLDILNKQFFT